MSYGLIRTICLTPVCCLLGLLISCSSDNVVGSKSWSCDVTLRLDSLTGDGNGSGGSRDEALFSALQTACSKLNLEQDQLDRCEQNLSFGKEQTFGNVTIVTPAEKSTRCSGSS